MGKITTKKERVDKGASLKILSRSDRPVRYTKGRQEGHFSTITFPKIVQGRLNCLRNSQETDLGKCIMHNP